MKSIVGMERPWYADYDPIFFRRSCLTFVILVSQGPAATDCLCQLFQGE